MKKQKWGFDPINSRILVEDASSNVLYTDHFEELEDIPDFVFETVCELHNKTPEKFNLGSEGSIDLYLLEEPLCSQEAREIIGNELYINYYSKL